MHKPFVHEMFAEIAQSHPELIAVESDDARLTYAELNERSGRIARALREMRLCRNGLVVIFSENTVQLAESMLGVLKAGGGFVPMTPSLPDRRLKVLIEQCLPSLVLGEGALLRRFTALCEELGHAIQAVEINGSEAAGAASALSEDRDGDDLSYIFFTSGSTGAPKPIAGRLKAIDHFIRWEIETLKLGIGTRVSRLTSPMFDAFLRDIFVPLCSGGTVCIPPGPEVLLDGKNLGEWIESRRIQVVHAVPSVFRPVLNHFAALPNGEKRFADLRYVLLAGEPLLPADVKKWYSVVTEEARLVNLYGPSETTMTKFAYFVTQADQARRSIPIGRTMDGAKALVVDDKGRACRAGMAGEIYIRTPYRALGYYRRKDLTDLVFIPNPFTNNPEDIIYKTGDLARVLEDGNFEFLGRQDKQVKVRGVRIELSEIEAALHEFDGVRQAAVIDRKDVNGDNYLCAYVVTRDEIESGSLRKFLAARLPEYMVPGVYVRMNDLPLMPNGKLDRRALPEPERSRDRSLEIPRNAEEEIIAGIWARILKRKDIGVLDDFFELGGHSLLATQVMSRVRQVLGAEVPLRVLFEEPTVRRLAEQVKKAQGGGGEGAELKIGRVSREGELPLSYAQQRLWFLEQLEPGRATYNMAYGLRLSGRLDRGALERSVEEIVKRHEVLRTSFPEREGRAVQRIAEEWKPEVEEADVSGLEEEERERAAERAAAEEAVRSFDLGRGPLVRVKLVKLEEREHVLLVTMHHIVSDGWSMGIVVKEFGRLYGEQVKGEEGGLEPLEVQYADYAVWQREWLKGEGPRRQLEYWKKQLRGAPVLELPVDHARSGARSGRGGRVSFRWESELSERLREQGRREGVTLFMLLLAGLDVVLSRYAGQREIVVGTPVANRNRVEIEGLIGFFVNTLALRVEVRERERIGELLKRVREMALEAYENQDVPFERVVEELQPERDLGRTPLFEVMLVVQNTQAVELEIGGLKVRNADAGGRAGVAKFGLTMMVREAERGEIEGELEYETELFGAERMERMAGHLRMVMEALAGDAEREVGGVEMLTEREREQLLVEWNRTEREYEEETGLEEWFERQAERIPEAVAVEDREQQLSYGELERRAGEMAEYLEKLGVGEEKRVGLWVRRGVEMVVGMLGILKAGGAYVPLDPEYPEERLRYMVEDTGMEVLLKQGGGVEKATGSSRVRVVDIEEEIYGGRSGGRKRREKEEKGKKRKRGGRGENLAYVIYTSGSTGRPKGVGITHRSAGVLMQWAGEKFGRKELDGTLASTSICFDLSIFEIFVPLSWGGTVVIAENALEANSVCGGGRVSLISMVPSAMREMIRLKSMPAGVKVATLGGETLPGALVRDIYGSEGVKVEQVWNLYGPTEDTTCTTATLVRREEERAGAPIGRPVAKTRVYVLDGEGRPVAVGVTGELYVGGSGLARGYVNRAELTAERFVPDGLSGEEGARLYRTGDVVRYRENGELEYLGRNDQQVKLRGYRIDLGEIEAALRESGKVEETAVVVREDREGDRRLVAYVVGQSSGEELRESIRKRLPEYMMPGQFVFLPALPLTSVGKVDRRALPAVEPRARQPFIPPRTAREKLMARIWGETLAKKEMGIHDNFFELGGHSLLATQVIARVRGEFSVDLPLRSLFESPTIAGLMEALERCEAVKRGKEDLLLSGIRHKPVEQMLSNIENLSDDEARELLRMEQETAR